MAFPHGLSTLDDTCAIVSITGGKIYDSGSNIRVLHQHDP